MLTPLDLNGKTFSKGFRGYDTDEVNQFFSQISRDYERLYQDNVELKDSVERVSAKLEYYQRMETTMQSTLVVAQETADEVKKNSMQKAEVLTKETELACNKQKEAAASFCNKLRADTEAEVTRMKSEADAYADKVRKMADEYASKTRVEADDYDKSTRTDADSYALGLRSKTDTSTSKLREDAQSFVDKMKSLAEIEVAKLKVQTEDSCKSQLAESREQARTLTAEASAHANQVMADANQQSQNIVAEATQKAHEIIANAQKQSQNMIIEATQRSQRMLHEATERSQKMVFIAETKAAAAMDTYNTMVNKANSQSKQFKSLLQSQLSLYDNFDAEYAVEQMVQPKLNAVKTAEPVLETKAEPVVAGTDDAVAEVVEAGKTEPAEAEVVNKTVQEEAVKNAATEMPVQKNATETTEAKPAAEAAKEEPAGANFTEAAKANAAAAKDDKTAISEKGSAVTAENENLNEGGKTFIIESNGNIGMRKPLFSRFNPRGSMVFNRNGFPRKNADLRIALSELQKSAEPKPQSGNTDAELKNNDTKSETQNTNPKPEDNKES